MGAANDEVRSGSFLGRVVRWTDSGLEVEGNQKVIRSLLEESEMHGCAGVSTPGVKAEPSEEEAPDMEPRQATLYRRGAAKANYISQDRPDISYASKELSRSMARPRVGDEVPLKRLARYLQKYPRCVLLYPWQEPTTQLTSYTDSDWGGCVKTRKSTSGGCVMKGDHLLLWWSRTQQLIALSSAEAELNASIKAGVESLGVANMGRELNAEHSIEVLCDASANIGINLRVGAGKIKHLGVRQLWLQERVFNGDLKIKKIPRLDNCSDALTHHWTAHDGQTHFDSMKTLRCGQ